VSNHLAIAAVTATLRNLLDEIRIDFPATDITTRAPKQARPNENKTQVNLFLYQTRPNTGWRNSDLPGRTQQGETGYPPLGIDLFYLLTAYGAGGDEVLAHQVLGRAMSILHDHSVLGRDEIRNALAGNDLHDQIERVRISQEMLLLDDLYKLWSSFQMDYHISAAYQASVVLIESQRPTITPLPVLQVDIGAHTSLLPPYPTILSLGLPNGQTSARLGDTLEVRGHHLSGTTVEVNFRNERLTAPIVLNPGGTATDKTIQITLPNTPAAQSAWAAGLYRVAVHITDSSGQVRVTNEAPMALAPGITNVTPNPAALGIGGEVTLTVACQPNLRTDQRVSLLVGSNEYGLRSISGANANFDVSPRPDVYFVRLRVDGIDSILVDRTQTPPIYDPNAKVTFTP
jgi:hypothetical protein